MQTGVVVILDHATEIERETLEKHTDRQLTISLESVTCLKGAVLSSEVAEAGTVVAVNQVQTCALVLTRVAGTVINVH